MASANAIRKHIENVEALKEASRIRIDRLMRQLTPEEIIRGNAVRLARRLTNDAGNAMLGEIADAMAEARSWAKATGLQPLTQREARAIAEEVMKDWRVAFEAQARRAIKDLQEQFRRGLKKGLSGDALDKVLKREKIAEKMQDELARKTKPLGPSMTNDIGKRVRDESLGRTPGKFTWVTTEDDHVCEDTFDTACADRHGEEMTIKEWRAVGLPGSPVLLCSSFGRIQCRCEIVASGSRDPDTFEKVNVKDAIKKGKDRARDET